jgi:hypothetical protein
MTRRVLALFSIVALAGITACERGPSGPVAGTLKVKLTMPAANSGLDGAILFTITGPAAPGVTAAGASGLRVFHEALAPTTRYAVTGTLTAGATIMTISVDDVGEDYTATIQQVAQTSGYQLRTLTGYALAVTR